MFANVYGLDLGTYEIKVYDKKSNSTWKEKNTIAFRNKKEIFAVGDEAYSMFEKAPQNIDIVFPMKEGVISRFYDMQDLLEHLLKKERRHTRGSKYFIAVPTDVTEVEKKAFYDLVIHSSAKAKEVRIVERGLADAVGIGLDVRNLPGICIVNFGGETTEMSVLSSGGLVLSRILKIGGKNMDQDIINQIRYNMEFLIGRSSAEGIRKSIGIGDDGKSRVLTVSGRDLRQGIPELKDIPVPLVRNAIKERLDACIREIVVLLERTPPEVLRPIQQSGIYLTGGASALKGLPGYIRSCTGFQVNAMPDPEFCTVSGLKRIIQSRSLKQLTYSMLDEDYRWMK